MTTPAFFVSLLCIFSLARAETPTAVVSTHKVAQRIDELLAAHFIAENVQPTGIVNDEDFLRRVSLDIAGVVPSPQEVTRFALDPAVDKRVRKIDELLASPDYGKIWGSYWKDVVISRATEQRVRLAEPAFHNWLIEQFDNNRPWHELARELITATGSVSSEGQTGLIFAHTGQPEEVAAEVSRIFMGIQMSCANCHDHPTDSWKREQFHELAAFFPRMQVRPQTPGELRTYAVTSGDFSQQSRNRRNFDPVQILRTLDRNRDGKLSKVESRGPLADRFDRMLALGDADQDGLLSKAELVAVYERQQGNEQPGRGSAEYYMPDLNDPSSPWTLMKPAFFIDGVHRPRVPTGADDLTRRNLLADYITSPANPWFAKALVNRMWSEMLGQGFYMPIDDMGPQRFPVYEDVIDELAQQFVNSGHDIKWLLKTIASTSAYQRQMQPDGEEVTTPFAAATPMRLRADQIYNAMTEVLGLNSLSAFDSGNARGTLAYRGNGLDPARKAFAERFNFDASTPQEDLLGNVPQALFMMNSPQLENYIRGTGDTKLSRILNKYSDNVTAVEELYLLVLTRYPSDAEVEITMEYIQAADTRTVAFEDIMWSLMNSTEFISKR